MRMSMYDAMELARIVNEKMQIRQPRLGMKLGRSASPRRCCINNEPVLCRLGA